MNLTPLLITFALFGGIMLAIGGYYADIQTVYSPVNSTTLSQFQPFNSSLSSMNEKVERIINRSTSMAGKSDLTKYYDAALAFIDVGAVIAEFPSYMTNYVAAMLNFMPGFIPTWLGFTIGLIIIIIFAMKIASIVMKTGEI